ncbi:UNVERIFIED_CONTAM: Zinc finger CCCH domain-containing protein 7B [Siphonaria sp. JEL0065]|nr:Zinc finger CCCH domain-containing protein 7B [Siphonaria sp. JEL0065]
MNERLYVPAEAENYRVVDLVVHMPVMEEDLSNADLDALARKVQVLIRQEQILLTFELCLQEYLDLQFAPSNASTIKAKVFILTTLISNLVGLGDPRRLPSNFSLLLRNLDSLTEVDNIVCRAAIEFLVDTLTAGKLTLRAAISVDAIQLTPPPFWSSTEPLFNALKTALSFRWESQAFYISQQCTSLFDKLQFADARLLTIQTLEKFDSEPSFGNRLNYLKDNCLLFYLGSLLQGHSIPPTPTEISYFQRVEKSTLDENHMYYRAIGSYLSYLLTVLQGNPSPRKLFAAKKRFTDLSASDLDLLVFHWEEPVAMRSAIYDAKGWMSFVRMDIDRSNTSPVISPMTDVDSKNLSPIDQQMIFSVSEDSSSEVLEASELINARKYFPIGQECNQCSKPRSESTPLKQCQNCQSVYYCSSNCQKQAWKTGNHKRYCRPVGAYRVGDVVRIHGILDPSESELNGSCSEIVWAANKEKTVWGVLCDGEKEAVYQVRGENLRLLVTREEVLDVYNEAGEQAPFHVSEKDL